MENALLFVFRHAPYGSSLAREGLEAVLAAGVFDQEVAVLFINDGVWQLVQGQDTVGTHQKNHSKALAALSLYGVSNLFVHQPSIIARSLTKKHLCMAIDEVGNHQVAEMMNSARHIISF